MKKLKLIVLIVLVLVLSGSAQAGQPSLGVLTVKYWQGLNRDQQFYYLMGALDALIIDCRDDLSTLGAMDNVLRNRIRDGKVQSADPIYKVINKVAVDFGCDTLLPGTDVTPVGR